MREKRVLPALNRMSQRLSSAEQLELFLDVALDGLLEVLEADAGWFLLLAPGREKPLAAAWRGCPDDIKPKVVSLARRQANDAFIMPDLAREPDLAALARAGFASLIALPPRTGTFQECLGAVARRPAAFNSESAEAIKLTASLIGAALERGDLSRSLADLTAAPHPVTSNMREFERIAAIAAERYREVRQALERAVDRARQIDKKFTQATIDLLRETARWEELLKQYEAEPAASTAAPAETATVVPTPTLASETAPEEPPITSEAAAAPEEAAEETFIVHTNRMQAFRRSHANL
jgi:hypothetical protein